MGQMEEIEPVKKDKGSVFIAARKAKVLEENAHIEH